MKILGLQISKYWLVAIMLTASLATVAASSPIWSNKVTTTINQTPWTGTVVLNNVNAAYNTGDSITLTATLNPLPTTYQVQQDVIFYYNKTSTLSTPPLPEQLNYIGATKPASTIKTVNGIAQITFTGTNPGNYIFIAEVESPK